MKFLFLDHDGVLVTDNDFACHKNNTFDRTPFSKNCVSVVNEIIALTGIEIITTSDWRNDFSLEDMRRWYFMNGLCKGPIGYTPNSKTYSGMNIESGRTDEIMSYVNLHRIKNWVAVDDLKMDGLNPHFVHCPKHSEGIRQKGIKENIIEKLKIDYYFPNGHIL